MLPNGAKFAPYPTPMDEKKIIILEHDSEADTCRKEVTPKLYVSEWTDE